MLHLAKTDGRIEKSALLGVDTSVLTLEGVRFAFDVSNKTGVRISDIAAASDQIDYEAINYYMDWRVEPGKSRRAAVDKCEILVPDHIPMKYLTIPNG
jgi:hypothetical protein